MPIKYSGGYAILDLKGRSFPDGTGGDYVTMPEDLAEIVKGVAKSGKPVYICNGSFLGYDPLSGAIPLERNASSGELTLQAGDYTVYIKPDDGSWSYDI